MMLLLQIIFGPSIQVVFLAMVLVTNTNRAYSTSSSIDDITEWSHEGNNFITVRGRDGTIVVSPKGNPSTEQQTITNPSATVIFCHGLGDTAEGWVDVVEQFATQMNHVKFILPTAPIQRVTLDRGRTMPSWYDIVGFDDKFDERCSGILESREIIRSILSAEHEQSGTPYSRMALAGHSQGASLSLFAALTQPIPEQKLAGTLVISGYLASGKHKFKLTPGLEDTPILHCHGMLDDIVPYEMAHKSKQLLQTKYGAKNYTIKSYPNLVHDVIDEELKDAVSFLQSILPPIEDKVCSNKNP